MNLGLAVINLIAIGAVVIVLSILLHAQRDTLKMHKAFMASWLEWKNVADARITALEAVMKINRN